MQKVVGLGPIDPDIVQPILGEGITFVGEPTSEDLSVAVGAIVRAAYVFDQKVLDSMPALKVIARTGVGTELVDLEAAAAREIPVLITPGSNTNAVAEGAIAHALHLAKRLGPLTKVVANGRWADRENHSVGDLESKTMGIVGYGRIGQRVAKLAQAFDMKIKAYDPFIELPAEIGVASVDQLFATSDVISLHVPLTEATHHMVNADRLHKIRPGAILVNCGRGSLMELDAVLDALNDGRLAGVGLDVFDPEPPTHHALFDHENVVLTPHMMGLSIQATKATYEMAALGVRDVLEGKQPAAVANK